MADVAVKFGLGAGGGINFTDPREFMRVRIPAGALSMFTEAASIVTSDTANGVTELGKRGMTDDTNWTANTYKTILSVAAGTSVIVAGMFGPTGLVGTPTTTFEITGNDGVAREIAITAVGTGARAYLGGLAAGSAGPALNMFTTTSVAFAGSVGITAAKDVLTLGTTVTCPIPGWQFVKSMGMPCLISRNGLTVRMKSSENNSTTTNQERVAQIQYMVLS